MNNLLYNLNLIYDSNFIYNSQFKITLWIIPQNLHFVKKNFILYHIFRILSTIKLFFYKKILIFKKQNGFLKGKERLNVASNYCLHRFQGGIDFFYNGSLDGFNYENFDFHSFSPFCKTYWVLSWDDAALLRLWFYRFSKPQPLLWN